MRYTLESLDPYLSGMEIWPVVTELKAEALGLLLGANISATAVRWMMDSEGKRWQARYFLIHSQGGGLTGEAYCLFSRFHMGTSKISLIRVAICDHQAKCFSTPEQRRRGWHRAKCTKCGLDMSVDSGD